MIIKINKSIEQRNNEQKNEQKIPEQKNIIPLIYKKPEIKIKKNRNE